MANSSGERLRARNLGRRDVLKVGVVSGMSLFTGLPILRAAGKPRLGFDGMRLSLAGYSFRQYLPRNWPTPRRSNSTMTMLDFVEYCGSLGIDGCELTSYYFPNPLTDDYLTEINELVAARNLEVSGTAIGNDFCLPEGDARQAELAMTRQWIDYAALMDAPTIRIFAGEVPPGGSEAVAIQRCIDGINESLQYAEQKGVKLALENHGGITSTPEQMMRIINGVKPSDSFGVNFDSGNFVTEDPYRDLQKIAPLAISAQIKVLVAPNGKEQPADLERIIKILKDANYSGWVILEYEEEGPRKNIPGYLSQLRKLIQS